MPTRGQVKRALAWADYLGRPRLKRPNRLIPKCVTCGGEASGEFARGEPKYDCRHDELRISVADLERGRREFGPRE